MSRFPGNIIKLPNVTPTQSSAQGVWSLKDQLVYQRNNQWPFQRDPYFNYTTLLLQGNVPNTTGPQAMTQPLAYNSDASTNNFLVTPNGDVSPRPFSPYFGGAYSSYFGGDGNYLSAAYSTDWAFSGDFSIETWVNIQDAGRSNDAVKAGAIITQGASGVTTNAWAFYFVITNGVISQVAFEVGTTTPVTVSSQTISLNAWHHFVVCRSGSTLSIFVDGNKIATNASYSTSISANASGTLQTARNSYGSPYQNWIKGYFSNIRIVNGSSAYNAAAATLVVPTGPLTAITNTKLLACAANRFIDTNTETTAKTLTVTGTPSVTDNSPFVSTDFTTGAGYFDASGDALSLASTSAFLPTGTQDYCLEMWVHPTTLSNTTYPCLAINAVTSGFQLVYYGDGGANNGKLAIGTVGASPVVTATFTSYVNQWVHVVATRSGNAHRLFFNGVLQGYASNSVSWAALSTQYIGYTSGNVQGYISGVRSTLSSIPTAYQTSSTTVGTAIFTPPTTPPTQTSEGASSPALITLLTRAASQNIGFIDSSPNEFIVTKNGNTTQGTFSPFSPTGWSNSFDGTDDFLSIPDNSNFDLAAGEWTFETWFNLNALATSAVATFLAQWTGSINAYWFYVYNSAGTHRFDFVYSTTGANQTILTFTPSSNLSLNTWYHFAGVRSGNNLFVYLNGNLVGTSQPLNVTLYNSSAAIYLGAQQGGTGPDYELNGYLSNTRLVKGQALYTGAFTPATAPLTATTVGTSGTNVASSLTGTVALLTCQSNRFRDNSPTNSTVTPSGNVSVQAFSPFAPATQSSPLVTGGSGYFDGTTDYLTWTGTAAGSGAFCYEFWIYSLNGFATMRAPLGVIATSGYNSALDIRMTSTTINVSQYNVANNNFTVPALQANTWYHVVACRNASNQTTVFLNGERSSTGAATISTNFSGLTSAIGRLDPSNGGDVTGYIAGVRLIVGSTPYDPTQTNIVVPTAPPTAIPNTSLLLNFTGGGIVDATGKGMCETSGAAQIGTRLSKWGNGSISFNGTSQTSLLFPVSQTYSPFTGDYTYEFWINFNSFSVVQIMLETRTSGGSNPGLQLFCTTGGVLTLYGGSTTGTLLITGGTLSSGQWYHIALVRSGSGSNNTKLYLNGTQTGSSATDTTNYNNQRIVLGAYVDNNNNFCNAYMNDFRFTKLARYTSNFNTNLPTGPFPIG